MRRIFLAVFFVVLLFDVNLISHAPRAKAQTVSAASFSAAFDSVGPFALNAKFAGLPKCSKLAGCTGYLLVCNTTNTGAPDPTQCVKLNASASFRTLLAVEVDQETVTSTATSSATYIVGTLPVKPSGVDVNSAP